MTSFFHPKLNAWARSFLFAPVRGKDRCQFSSQPDFLPFRRALLRLRRRVLRRPFPSIPSLTLGRVLFYLRLFAGKTAASFLANQIFYLFVERYFDFAGGFGGGNSMQCGVTSAIFGVTSALTFRTAHAIPPNSISWNS